MNKRLSLCVITLSLGLLATGVKPLSAQTAAALASDPATVAASPTPATGTSLSSPAAVAPKVEKSGNRQPPHDRQKVSEKKLEKYDLNKNGVLDPEERAQMKKDRAELKAERLKKYDKNGDGKLDESEKATMHAEEKAARKAEKKAAKKAAAEATPAVAPVAQ